MKPIRIGTRSSALARWQTDFILAELRARDSGVAVEIIPIQTAGDELPEALVADFEGMGFFTSALERALLAGEIDLAVHSYKDLPVTSHAALVIAAVPSRGPVEDVLCSVRRVPLAALRPGARLGTSSARRTAQMRSLRPDLECVALRGNVATRLGRLRDGELDAIVLARAGLVRLGLTDAITEVFAIEDVLPAPAQGALAVQVRAADVGLGGRLAALDDRETRVGVEAERALLHALGGGCAVPVGAHARVRGGSLRLEAGVFGLDGRRVIRSRAEGPTPAAVAAAVARELLARGAGEILGIGERTLRPAPEVA